MTGHLTPSKDSGVSYCVLRMPTVASLTGYSARQIRRLIAAGTFPAPIALGPGSVGWRSDEVQAWLDSRPRVAYVERDPDAALAEAKQESLLRRASVRARRLSERGTA